MQQIGFAAMQADAGVRLNVFLRRQGVSVSLMRSLKYVEQGIQVNGAKAHTNYILQQGDIVTLQLPEEECTVPAQPVPFAPVYQSEHAVVIDKPAGLVVHPTRSHQGGTLANGFAYWMEQQGKSGPFRPIGRLDGDTSGLVLCAMNAYAAPLLAAGFAKSYLALVAGQPRQKGRIDAPLGPAEESVVQQAVYEGARPSVTEYQVLKSWRDASLVEVRPLTGRTHQIRAHFAHIGHPLLGDSLYGGDTTHISRHALHCASLAFYEPQGGQKILKSDLPPDMRGVIESL